MDPRKTPPAPIIDNLDFIDNPFKRRDFSTLPCIGDQVVAGADQDLEYALKFLYSYNGSSATFNSYRREIERLLQWAWRIERTTAIPLKREQIEEFIRFCSEPPLAWIGTKNVARFKTAPGGIRVSCEEWRPFVATVSKIEHKAGIQPDAKRFYPSQAAIRATFTALSSFYKYLVQEDLIAANPVALIRQKSKFIRKENQRAPVRRISNLQWDYVLETAERMAREDPQHERTLFIMNCLFAMYLRISELVADERSMPMMGDFRKDLDGNWWFHVTGKGNKNRTITVCDAMLLALKRYRRYLGLPALPNPGERVPLIAKTLGRGPVTSSRNIRKIVQACFDRSYARMCEEGLAEDAGELKAATVHWLRHTGISEDVKFRPREHVRDDAGHASMATTDRYIESDLRERHLSARRKRIKDL